MEKFKLFRYSLLAGLMIAIGGAVNLSVDNKVVGAFLFSIGLFTVVNQQFALFTGRVGDFKLKQPAFLIDLLIIWIGNFAATVGVGYLLRVTRVASTLSAKAETLSQAKLNDNPLSIFVLAIFCGIIMYIAVACFRSTENPIGKYAGVFIGVPVFILCGFEHCVANMFYFSIANAWTWKTFLWLLIMTAGNAVGGLLIPVIKCNIPYKKKKRISVQDEKDNHSK